MAGQDGSRRTRGDVKKMGFKKEKFTYQKKDHDITMWVFKDEFSRQRLREAIKS